MNANTNQHNTVKDIDSVLSHLNKAWAVVCFELDVENAISEISGPDENGLVKLDFLNQDWPVEKTLKITAGLKNGCIIASVETFPNEIKSKLISATLLKALSFCPSQSWQYLFIDEIYKNWLCYVQACDWLKNQNFSLQENYVRFRVIHDLQKTGNSFSTCQAWESLMDCGAGAGYDLIVSNIDAKWFEIKKYRPVAVLNEEQTGYTNSVVHTIQAEEYTQFLYRDSKTCDTYTDSLFDFFNSFKEIVEQSFNP